MRSRFLITLFPALAAILSLGSCLSSKSPPVSFAPSEAGLSLLQRILRYDAEVTAVVESSEAERILAVHAERISACGRSDIEAERWTSCLLKGLLGPEGFSATTEPAKPEASTAAYALSNREGSCAALVAIILAATEKHGAPFQAVVLRDHVLLGSRLSEGTYFEVLEGGRELSDLDLRRYSMPPGGPLGVDGEGYIPYYLDNLAARLAESGRPAQADELFESALELAPRAARLHYNYGTFLLGLDRNDEALTHLERTLELGWDDAATWVNRGVALSKLGRDRAARRSFGTALERDPTNREALLNIQKLEQR